MVRSLALIDSTMRIHSADLVASVITARSINTVATGLATNMVGAVDSV